MKKRFLASIIAGIMCLTLVSCGDKNEENDQGNSNTNVTENNDNNNDEGKADENEVKDEYKPFTIEEANTFNKDTIGKMEKLLNDKGFSVKAEENNFEGSLAEGPSTLGYKVNDGAKPFYASILYGAEIKDKFAKVSYQFKYIVDSEKIKSGEVAAPKSGDLLIAEPYKIMTGKDISNESLDKIDKLIEKYYVKGFNYSEEKIEVQGPFEITVKFSSGMLGFNITSSRYDG